MTMRTDALSDAAGGATTPNRSGTATAAAGRRIASIDALRGLVMILMALDHARDFLGPGEFNPRDVSDHALFLTRWVTHFCAPTFMLLVGVSAFQYAVRKGEAAASRFLLTRGLWLVLIEFTLVKFAWTFRPNLFLILQVLFAIGVSMILLAGLLRLPRAALGLFGLALIAGHNLLDGVAAAQLGAMAPLWQILHEPGTIGAPPRAIVVYPLLPWVGVMAVGYWLGPWFLQERAWRTGRLVGLGLAVTAGFVLLRLANAYGDPAPWSAGPDALTTTLSFLNTEKYPPSLLFLAMTLGAALIMLALLEFAPHGATRPLVVYGQAPFFFYVAHLYVLHGLGVATGAGLRLSLIYAAWAASVLALYAPCLWFARLKQTRRGWWWSYL